LLDLESSKPQGLSALFDKTKAHLKQHTLGMLFLFIYFIAKKDMSHQN